jgi:hypothetical protein
VLSFRDIIKRNRLRHFEGVHVWASHVLVLPAFVIKLVPHRSVCDVAQNALTLHGVYYRYSSSANTPRLAYCCNQHSAKLGRIRSRNFASFAVEASRLDGIQ